MLVWMAVIRRGSIPRMAAVRGGSAAVRSGAAVRFGTTVRGDCATIRFGATVGPTFTICIKFNSLYSISSSLVCVAFFGVCQSTVIVGLGKFRVHSLRSVTRELSCPYPTQKKPQSFLTCASPGCRTPGLLKTLNELDICLK